MIWGGLAAVPRERVAMVSAIVWRDRTLSRRDVAHGFRAQDHGFFPGRNPIGAIFVIFLTVVVLLGAGREVFPQGSESRQSSTRVVAAAPASSAALNLAVPPDSVPMPPGVSRQIVTPTPPATEAVETYEGPANELGRIQIFMYHAFVEDPENTDDWTITFDQFREQLDWLHENDFVLVGLNSVIEREFDVPAGKRPVILTFDDASARQFGLQESAEGGYEVRPDTAVGVLEEYRAMYPEFVQSAFFAVLPFNCFTAEDDPSTCEERLTWLVEHDYEVGNHTLTHENLTVVTDERFKKEVVEAAWWLSERLDRKNNLSDVLVLPFGAYPSADYQAAWLFDGFWHYGEYFVPSLVLEVGGGPARSPFSLKWTTNQSRCNTDPTSFWSWADKVESGEVEMFMSDGDPDVVTVPAGWEEHVNHDLLERDGRMLRVND